MIEQLMQNLIDALNANTAAHTGGAASTAADAKTTTGKTTTGKTTTGKTTTPKGPSREDVVTLLTKIKDAFGAPEAKPLIQLAGVAKMAEIPDDKLKLVFDAATKRLAELESPEPEGEGEDEGL